jgi:hypothetical protein
MGIHPDYFHQDYLHNCHHLGPPTVFHLVGTGPRHWNIRHRLHLDNLHDLQWRFRILQGSHPHCYQRCCRQNRLSLYLSIELGLLEKHLHRLQGEQVPLQLGLTNRHHHCLYNQTCLKLNFHTNLNNHLKQEYLAHHQSSHYRCLSTDIGKAGICQPG